MSLRAYQQAAQRAETPRDVEYRLFAQVTRALMDVQAKPRGRPRAPGSTCCTGIAASGRRWPTIAPVPPTRCRRPRGAQIISLSLFVHRHTSHVMRREADIEALIDINRMMMQGLSGRTEAA